MYTREGTRDTCVLLAGRVRQKEWLWIYGGSYHPQVLLISVLLALS